MTRSISKKTDVRSNKGTLDQKHTEKINRFKAMTESIDYKKKKLNDMEREYSKLCNKGPRKIDQSDIHRKAELKNLIRNEKKEIDDIENQVDELEYVSSTKDFLINYYDNEDVLSDTDAIDEINDNRTKKNILDYLTVDKTKPIAKSSSKKSQVKRISKANLYEQYITVIDKTHFRKTKIDRLNVCDKCDGEKVVVPSDGCHVCQECGDVEIILISTEKPKYKEPTQDTGTYAYKRINHLAELLSQIQAKGLINIPAKVYDNIYREIKKRKINKDDLDIFRLRKILKKLSYRKYYENAPHMLQIINSKEPPNFSREDELKIKKMFKDIQKPFSLYCPKDRKNFLNYSYVLHKFCELLELDDYIEYFPLLKNQTKLKQHDKIWRNICKHMKWKFYKSI